MRTTLTLDEDVDAAVRAAVQRDGRSYRETINALLRRGLAADQVGESPAAYRVHARPMDLRPGVQIDDVAGLLDELDEV